MAQSAQATPTLQANIGGTTTTVNQRDWLNIRISPFLKKALIESLDSEAEFPLQWLGEHLIQQSILFERNPDTTNIQERFRYKHEPKAPAILAQNTAPPQAPPTQPSILSPQVNQTTNHVASTPAIPVTSNQIVSSANPTVPTRAIEGSSESATTPAVDVNGTTENPTGPVQDTEMSNAP